MDLAKSIDENQNIVVARLANHVIATVANGSNLVFSPTSINVLLGLIAAGSNGVTKEEILSFLMSTSPDHLNIVLAQIIEGNKRSDLYLSAANGVWIDESFSLKPSFKELLENSYKAMFSQVDFASKPTEVIDEMNTWAEANTNGLIKEILSRDYVETISKSTLILANAVYFKGSWSRKFDANSTNDDDFHLFDGSSVKVPFMTNCENQYLRSYDGFQVLRLPYVEDHRQFSMYIYLPNDQNGLHALLEKIGSEPRFFDIHIPLNRVPVGVFRVPKFKFGFEFMVSDVLKDMGLTSPFSTKGNLTEMADSSCDRDDLYVSSIVHKACIEVDEEGTEAAAISVAVMMRCCLRKNLDFVADHPFLFTVREDKSGVILFIGQVLDPSKH